MDEKKYNINESEWRIIINGTLDELIGVIKKIHREKRPHEDIDYLDEEIDIALMEELPHLKDYLSGNINLWEFQNRYKGWAKLRFWMTHSVSLELNTWWKTPTIELHYYANN